MYSRMAISLAVVLFLSLTAIAPCPAAEEPAAKDAAVIALKHASPSYLMRLLGLVSVEDFRAGKTTAWFRSAAAAEEPKTDFSMPPGIDIVVPCEPDKSLIVYGAKDAIDRFRIITTMLDVEPKHVQVKAQFCRVTPDQMKQIGLMADFSKDASGTTVAYDPEGLVSKALKDLNIAPIASPVITTINNQPAHIAVSRQVPCYVNVTTVDGDKVKRETKPQSINVETALDVTPRVNGDGTITLIVEAKAPAGTSASAAVQELRTQGRAADGESLIIVGQPGGGERLLLIVTPTVIK